MEQQAQRYVITGASGFIGSHLLNRLVKDGFDVAALSRRGTGRTDVRDIRIADYSDSQALVSALSGASVVIHLAARAHQLDEYPGSARELYEEANVKTAVAVARASREAGLRRVVVLSSIGVNGHATHGTPFTETDEPAPTEAYAISKWQAEQAVANELRDGPTDFVILRPPLVYGAGCPGNFEKLLKLVAKAPVIPLGAVTAPRTFVFVENLVDAIVVAAKHPAASRRTFLVCDEQTLTVSEIVRMLAPALGRSPRAVLDVPIGALDFAARLAGKPQALAKLTAELQVDGGEFCRTTGWHAPVRPEQGLRDTAHAYRERGRS